MFFLIRRSIRADNNFSHKDYQTLLMQTRQLTIGRAPDQHLQINENLVEQCHALMTARKDGQLFIQAVTASDFLVNGEKFRSAELSPGDLIQIGSAMITIEQPQTDYPAILKIDYVFDANQETLDTLCNTNLSQTCLNKAFWSGLFAVCILMLFFIMPVSGLLSPHLGQILRENTLLPDDSLWSTGPLHPSHQAIGRDCNVCHATPFKTVTNHQCLQCHSKIQHHVKVTDQDVNLFPKDQCASCHSEHKEPTSLVQRDQRFCVDCHGNLNQLKNNTELVNVTDFGNDHPEFRLSLLNPYYTGQKTQWETIRVKPDPLTGIQENSSLQFSHKEHVDPKGIRSPDGDQVLACSDCHQPDASGRQMLPVAMEKHCNHCHSLDIDENNSGKQVPHGQLNAVYDTLKEYFSRQYLDPTLMETTELPADQRRRPGSEELMISSKERKMALDWTNTQSLIVAQDLIEDRVCIDCHQVSRMPGQTGFKQWFVKPVVLSKKWLPLASFDHASHVSETCTSCHENAEKSKASSDVLIPDIDTCRTCHAGGHDKDKLASECVMCHQFHLPNRGLLDETQRMNVRHSLTRGHPSEPKSSDKEIN